MNAIWSDRRLRVMASAEFEVGAGASIKMLDMNGITPSSATVQDATFPLARPLLLVTRGRPTGLAAAYIAFARSPAVHPLIKEQFFVPLQT